MSPTLLTGPELAPASGTVKQLVIFLHGVGADGNDLLGIARMMELPDTHFFSPHAPFAYDMAPSGRQWFSLADRNPQMMIQGIQIAAPILDATIDALMARYNLTPSQVALVGFSQGSMMSLYAAPRRAEPLAGVVAISGAMLAGDRLEAELKSRPPICLIHGKKDEVVPFGAMLQADKILQENDVRVETHARPMLGHGIDDEAIEIMEGFLAKVFSL
jgi:phospholipase/carboxylesterase